MPPRRWAVTAKRRRRRTKRPPREVAVLAEWDAVRAVQAAGLRGAETTIRAATGAVRGAGPKATKVTARVAAGALSRRSVHALGLVLAE